MRPTSLPLATALLVWSSCWAASLQAQEQSAEHLQGLPVAEHAFMPAIPQAYVEASLSGGPPKDGIPSIDDPRFWSSQEADRHFNDDDRVVGVYINGEARAYPQRILVWHEIVNDTVGGKPISVTFCPLTGTALGFLRGDSELGVSGRLVNSNLIMYDRATDTEWPQILGAGIKGPHAGKGLQETRVVWTTWQRWKQRHPDTRVLNTETSFIRSYRRDPYGSYTPVGGYYADHAQPIFPVMHESERYPPKREIFGFRTSDGHAVAVDRVHLARQEIIEHVRDGIRYLIVHDPGLDTGWVFRDRQGSAVLPAHLSFSVSGPDAPELSDWEAINGFEAMWFAWFAFYPDTEVLDGNGG